MRGGIALAPFVLVACATQLQIQANHDPDYDFTALKTYRWMPRKKSGDPRLDDARLEEIVKNKVDATLKEKGYRRVGKDPDFLIAYHAILARKRSRESLAGDYEYADVWGQNHAPRVWSEYQTYSREYTEGTLVLDIADPGTKHLIWRASTQTEVNLKKGGGKDGTRTRVHEALRRMLAFFPPK